MDDWSEGTHKTIAICAAVAAIALLVAITLWVIVANDAHTARSEIKAKACMKAPSAQVASCLKLNAN